MKTIKKTGAAPTMALDARSAADLMTPNPVSIGESVTVPEAAAFLAARRISAAPVIGRAGRTVGVVSRTDILRRGATRAGGTVRDVMTPGVFSVRPETPAADVIERMLALKVRRLFVVDGAGAPVGVISASDALRCLRRWGPAGEVPSPPGSCAGADRRLPASPRPGEGGPGVAELPLLLAGWEAAALEAAAHERGLTAAQFTRLLIRRFLGAAAGGLGRAQGVVAR